MIFRIEGDNYVEITESTKDVYEIRFMWYIACGEYMYLDIAKLYAHAEIPMHEILETIKDVLDNYKNEPNFKMGEK